MHKSKYLHFHPVQQSLFLNSFDIIYCQTNLHLKKNEKKNRILHEWHISNSNGPKSFLFPYFSFFLGGGEEGQEITMSYLMCLQSLKHLIHLYEV